jgi:plasmid stabilization system protein ParE
MENGYKIFWTDNALNELIANYEYLEINFTHKELNRLAKEIEKITTLISINPNLFSESELQKGIRKVVIEKYNTMYYRTKNDTIEILSFFSNRQNPSKIKI